MLTAAQFAIGLPEEKHCILGAAEYVLMAYIHKF